MESVAVRIDDLPTYEPEKESAPADPAPAAATTIMPRIQEIETFHTDTFIENQNAIDKNFIQFLRRADGISIRFERDNSASNYSDRYNVTLFFRNEDSARISFRPSGRKETIRIEHRHVFTNVLKGYWDNLSFSPHDGQVKPSTAYFYCHYINGAWSMFRQFVKPGDEITFSFRTNQSQLLNESHLFHDELVVSVKRKGFTIINHMVLEDEITRGNSCRAIKF